MISLLNRLGKSLWSAAAVVIGVLLLLLKIVWDLMQRLKKENRQLKADAEFRDDVDESDAEIDNVTDIRSRKIAKEIEEGKTVESLAEPNKWP